MANAPGLTKALSICVVLVLLAGCGRTYPGQQTARAAKVAAACAESGGRARYEDSWAYMSSIEVICVVDKGGEQ